MTSSVLRIVNNQIESKQISRQFTKIEARTKQITSANMSDCSNNSDNTSVRAQLSSGKEDELHLP